MADGMLLWELFDFFEQAWNTLGGSFPGFIPTCPIHDDPVGTV